MPKKRVATGLEGFSPVTIDKNTPEEEISCALNSSVDVGESKFCGVSESRSGQNSSTSVENSSQEKEICVVSGGLSQMKISAGPSREGEMVEYPGVVQDPVSLDKSGLVSDCV